MNLQDELYVLLSEAPLTSAQLREQLCMGQCPGLLAELQRRSGVDGRVPTVQQIGKTMRAFAAETGLVSGAKGGHHWTVLWSVGHGPSRAPADAPEGGPVAAMGNAAETADTVPVPSVDPTLALPKGWEKDPKRNPDLHAKGAPKGYHIRGESTLSDAAGNTVMRWTKTVQDREHLRIEAFLEALKSLAEPFHGVHEPTFAPACCNEDLLCVLPVGDPHLGAYIWGEETGSDYDVKIAERLHVDAIRKLVATAPPAKEALVISLGDLVHCDSNLARTSRSGNPLDTDTRYQHVLRVGIRMVRAMIDAALTKHEKVRVICEVGNHDDLSSPMLAATLEAFYDGDPRVTIDTSPQPFHWYRFGKCLLGTTHGSETKPDDLPMVMAQDRAKDWGETTNRHWYVGHVHHETVKEYPGCTVEWFRTLAPADAWAHRKGYRAGRDMRLHVWHKEHGLISQNRIGISQLV